ncbi:DegV family protein [Vallicoccus soli]|uniref:DegV family EDD domain-containing protein n=1 Tax=Vallicoccus soli TaxID=2339232 RepID=A0A3A3ZLH0_9ACTN|nr:DegV family protein [Vallicoccus soli]RJK97066.1 DegV family EDD domain-containing protein [Vallicoccus soli]
MSGRVAVVTDSTAALPPGLAGGLGVHVVALAVQVGDEAHADGPGLAPGAVADALRSGLRLRTSRPSPGDLAATYGRAAAEGAGAVVAVHLSGALSGTAEAALAAAGSSRVPVTVVDSRSLGLGLGYAVAAAARAAAAGAGAQEVAEAARRTAAGTSVLFSVASLEPLRRGGRGGAAARLVGAALGARPLMRLHDGVIVPVEKVRTPSRALARLEELAVEAAADRPVDLGVHHLAEPERAAALLERLRARVPGARAAHVAEVGAAVGAHVGPGALGVVVAPAGQEGA